MGAAMAWWWLIPNRLHYALVALVPLLFLPVGILGIRETTLGGYAHPLLGLFVAGLLMMRVLRANGGDLLIQYWIYRLRLGSVGVLIALSLAAALLSSVIANTAAAAFFVPIVAAAVLPFGDGRVTVGTNLAVAYAVTLGGLATMIGTPPNIITAETLAYYGGPVTFLQWLSIGPVVSAACLAIMLVLLLKLTRFPKTEAAIPSSLSGQAARPDLPRLILAVALFAGLVIAWTILEQKSLRAFQPFFWAFVAIFAVILLVPIGGRSMLKGDRQLFGTKSSLSPFLKSCDVLVLIGGGLALGQGIRASGGDAWLAEKLAAFGGLPPLLLLLALGLSMTFAGELLSNTAMAALFMPILIGGSQGFGLDRTVLGLAVGLCMSHGYILIVATPPNAIMMTELDAGEKREYQRLMRQVGIPLDILAAAVTVTLVWLLRR